MTEIILKVSIGLALTVGMTWYLLNHTWLFFTGSMPFPVFWGMFIKWVIYILFIIAFGAFITKIIIK